MWRTELGERILEGPEAALFRDAVADLIDPPNLCEDHDYQVGVDVFDHLTYGQKLAMLDHVANALLRPEVPAPELTALSEGTVAAVFHHLKIMVRVEIELSEMGPIWRPKVLDACRLTELEDLPASDCDDMQEWDFLVEALLDRILWDRDYDEQWLSDVNPGEARAVGDLIGIPEDYFTHIAPDPGPQQLRQIRDDLQQLLGLTRP